MAIIMTKLEFEYPAPKDEDIIEMISEIAGLPVSIVDVSEDYYRYDCNMHIAFDSFPDHKIKIYSYRPGVIKKILREKMEEDGFDPNWPCPVEGSDEKEGKQNLYLNAYHGQELTLYDAAIQALVSLGGISRHPGLGLCDEFNFPVSVSDLEKRHDMNNRRIKKDWIMIIMFLPFIIPYFIILAICGLIKMPFDLIRAYKEVKDRYPDRF